MSIGALFEAIQRSLIYSVNSYLDSKVLGRKDKVSLEH